MDRMAFEQRWEGGGVSQADRCLGKMRSRQRGWQSQDPRAGVCLGLLEPQKAPGARGAWQQVRTEKGRRVWTLEGLSEGLTLILDETSLGDFEQRRGT